MLCLSCFCFTSFLLLFYGINHFLLFSLHQVTYYPSCCFSVTQSSPTLCNPMDCSMPGLHVPHHLLEFAQVHAHCTVMPSSHLILWCPLLILPSIFPSIREFSNESSVCIRWLKYWNFNFSISCSSEHSGLISLKISWLKKKKKRLTGFISFLSKGLSVIFSSTTVWRHQFFDILPSLRSSSHNCTWPLGRP